MAQDPFVNQLQRVGIETSPGVAALAPGQSAIVFDGAVFSFVNVPAGTATGDGASIPGYTKVVANPALPPVTKATGQSTASVGASALLLTLAFAASTSTTLRFTLKARIDLLPTLTVGCDVAAVVLVVCPASGNPDPTGTVVSGDTIRSLGIVAPFAVMTTTVVVSGSSMTLTAALPALTAWQNTHAYTAGPNGTARHVVTNDSGKVYVCITAGTSAGSGGPTGTAADITDGTAYWAYVGTSVTINWALFTETLAG